MINSSLHFTRRKRKQCPFSSASSRPASATIVLESSLPCGISWIIGAMFGQNLWWRSSLWPCTFVRSCSGERVGRAVVESRKGQVSWEDLGWDWNGCSVWVLRHYHPQYQMWLFGVRWLHISFEVWWRIDSHHAHSLETLLRLGAVIESLSLWRTRRNERTDEQLNRGRLIDSLRWVYVCISLLAGLMRHNRTVVEVECLVVLPGDDRFEPKIISKARKIVAGKVLFRPTDFLT